MRRVAYVGQAQGYLLPGEEDFYGWPTLARLARDLPDVPFLITGHDGTGLDGPPNVRFLGWVDSLERVLRDASVYVRLTEHDGLAWSVLEALSFCRHVIWTCEFPFCETHRDYDTTLAILRTLRATPHPNTAGGRHAWTVFAEQKVIDDCEALYRGVIAGRDA